jgi:uncharacterized protein YcaQ
VPRDRLSAAAARRVALAAQGFTEPRPAVADRRALRRVVKRTGVLQIDSVNVLARAHYLPLFSRLGAYDTSLLDDAVYRRPRMLFEYWAHEACVLPIEVQPLFRWRMDDVLKDAWGQIKRMAKEKPGFLEQVLADVAEHGPISAGQMSVLHSGERPKRKGPWWDWDDVKTALEYHFWSGAVTTAYRKGFERYYDLTERVLPRAVVDAPTPSREEAQRELLAKSARSLGVATAKELRDYYRLPAADTRLRIEELVDSGDLIAVEVEGWRGPAYLSPDARVPRRVTARALLAPFDPLVWERSRVERIFDFRYRIEIYVPADKREYGYYVLPFLLDEAIVARVDLKADRQAGVLRVQAAHVEADAPAHTASELRAELDLLAGWLGLSGVDVMPRGNLATALAATPSS